MSTITIGDLNNKALSTVGLGEDTSTSATPTLKQKVHYQTGFDKFLGGTGGDAILTTLEVLAFPVKILGSLTGCATQPTPCSENTDVQDKKWDEVFVMDDPVQPYECSSVSDALKITRDESDTGAGSTITIKQGRYLDEVDLTGRAGLTIRGEEGIAPTEITVTAPEKGLQTFLLADSNNIVMRNFTISDDGWGVGVYVNGGNDLIDTVDVEGEAVPAGYNLMLDGMIFHDNGDAGLQAENSRIWVRDTHFEIQRGRAIDLGTDTSAFLENISIHDSYPYSTDHVFYAHDASDVSVKGAVLAFNRTDSDLSDDGSGDLVRVDNTDFFKWVGSTIINNDVDGALMKTTTGIGHGSQDEYTSEIASVIMANNEANENIVNLTAYDQGLMWVHNLDINYNYNKGEWQQVYNEDTGNYEWVPPLLQNIISADTGGGANGVITLHNLAVSNNPTENEIIVGDEDPENNVVVDFSNFYNNGAAAIPEGSDYIFTDEPVWENPDGYIYDSYEDPEFWATAFRPSADSPLVHVGDTSAPLTDCGTTDRSTIGAYGGEFGGTDESGECTDMAETEALATDWYERRLSWNEHE